MNGHNNQQTSRINSKIQYTESITSKSTSGSSYDNRAVDIVWNNTRAKSIMREINLRKTVTCVIFYTSCFKSQYVWKICVIFFVSTKFACFKKPLNCLTTATSLWPSRIRIPKNRHLAPTTSLSQRSQISCYIT